MLVWHTEKQARHGRVWDHGGSDDPFYVDKFVDFNPGHRVWMKLCLGDYDTEKLVACQPHWRVGLTS